ncbi:MULTISPECIES: NAD-dependent epimerase/dehydratase family protein [unclassified Agrobacterium]|uniref:NAD-dependent epimerase/dehydratase family protein n=1 Tax=unclassified Agrobacterium TaxID=2632611 RepID=UPI00244910AA|nr:MULTISPECIES: NAD-dependent epimerase/dehydratase family protein [unclassified Agrobacterium]MDH0613943.1 NAD-dependent epimerase/dehydratase family protein [Agrobacterium sp. GD03872]MDH0696832.1 NAD-dependent epimerase/dehydratase family protein [Agrobacterium sp. GD03871]MDH1060004.1 NAD-dependent epimerase/dehydratase family protein [Agrobacterium sp. GD03992]MDH2209917.1 NAD-dependent epimerase/dehydratase family protein [Agrobacterium sp. GD03643]MDH2219416.1 NAD-dependent epimerase/d
MIYENNANAARNERPLALILGVNGGVGSQVSRMLQQRGWRVRAMTRQRGSTGATDGIERVTGDAMNRQDVMDAAKGASLIVHAVNPPGYRNWESQVLPMLDNSIAAAEACGARIVFPGSVYNFGTDAFPLLTEDSPQKPFTRKGALRVEMERRLKMASMRGVPVLIVRAGDFFGPDARNNWFSQMLVRPGKPVRSVQNPAAPHAGHQWAYLPDVAETIGRLLDRADALPAFAVYHMEGFWDFDGLQLVEAIERVVGHPVKRRQLSWSGIKLAAPFVPLFREVLEMQYLWQMPIRMSNRRLTDFLGTEPRTPIDIAVATTLASLGCLEQRPQPSSLPHPADAGGRV